MKKRMKAVAMFAALVMGLSLIGCSDEDDDGTSVPERPDITQEGDGEKDDDTSVPELGDTNTEVGDEDDDDGATGPDVEAALPETVGTDPFTSGLYMKPNVERVRIVFTENDRFLRGYSIAIDTSQRTITLQGSSSTSPFNMQNRNAVLGYSYNSEDETVTLALSKRAIDNDDGTRSWINKADLIARCQSAVGQNVIDEDGAEHTVTQDEMDAEIARIEADFAATLTYRYEKKPDGSILLTLETVVDGCDAEVTLTPVSD